MTAAVWVESGERVGKRLGGGVLGRGDGSVEVSQSFGPTKDFPVLPALHSGVVCETGRLLNLAATIGEARSLQYGSNGGRVIMSYGALSRPAPGRCRQAPLLTPHRLWTCGLSKQGSRLRKHWQRAFSRLMLPPAALPQSDITETVLRKCLNSCQAAPW